MSADEMSDDAMSNDEFWAAHNAFWAKMHAGFDAAAARNGGGDFGIGGDGVGEGVQQNDCDARTRRTRMRRRLMAARYRTRIGAALARRMARIAKRARARRGAA
jgi:hypothetical protein